MSSSSASTTTSLSLSTATTTTTTRQQQQYVISNISHKQLKHPLQQQHINSSSITRPSTSSSTTLTHHLQQQLFQIKIKIFFRFNCKLFAYFYLKNIKIYKIKNKISLLINFFFKYQPPTRLRSQCHHVNYVFHALG